MIEKKILNYFIFFPVILWIGIFTSIEDYKKSIIRNKWIVVGLLYTFSIYLLCWLFFLIKIYTQKVFFLNETCSYLLINFNRWSINLIISTIVSYVLWRFEIWAAGDAKLFICYSSLIPLSQYSRIYFDYYFASFSLLAAAFIPLGTYLILNEIIKHLQLLTFKKIALQKWDQKIKNFDWKLFIKMTLGYILMYLCFRLLEKKFKNFIGLFTDNEQIIFIIAYFIYKPLRTLIKKNIKIPIPALLFFCLFFLIFDLSYSWQNFSNELSRIFRFSLVTMVFIAIINYIVAFYIKKISKDNISFAPWIFLGVLIIWFL